MQILPFFKRLLKELGSLRLSVFLLGFSVLLVFFGNPTARCGLVVVVVVVIFDPREARPLLPINHRPSFALGFGKWMPRAYEDGAIRA